MVGALALAACVLFSSAVRIHGAFADPNFDRASPEGMLKSDPALLYYLVERFLDSGGAFPDDFRADPRIQWPDTTDVPAELGVGQEPLVAAAYALLGRDGPLHVFCVRFMAVVASLSAVGVYLATLGLTRSVRASAVAAALFAALPANYRTVGFILVREDVALPLFALHLAALAWAATSRRAWAAFLAGALLAAALSTWHALTFVAALEAAVFFAWLLRTGRSPFTGSLALGLVPLVLAAELVPMLRLARFLEAAPMLLALALFAAALAPRRPRLVALVTLLALLACSLGAARLGGDGPGAYAHVFDFLRAKLAHGNLLPADPDELSFDARLLWQGPFEPLPLAATARAHAWVLLLLVPVAAIGLSALARGTPARPGESGGAHAACLALGVLASLPLAWSIGRTLVLFGLLAPIACAVVLERVRWRRPALFLQVAVLLLQLVILARWPWELGSSWYRPPGRQAEIAELVRWVRANLPREAPIVGDFVNSTALLAHCRNPIVLQPKYETDAARRRAEEFLTTFFFGTPADLARLVRERFRSRHLLIDRYTLGVLSRYAAGLAEGEEPPADAAAAVFLGQDEARLGSVPGFELLYRSPPSIRQVNGAPYDFFRLYRVE